MMTDELILHLWEAFVGDTTLTARQLNDDDKIAFANAVLNAAKESDARRREKSATHEPVTFTPWDSLPWKPKPIGFARRSEIELYEKVLTIRPPDAEHEVALFTRDQLQRAVSAALKEFEGMHWVDLDTPSIKRDDERMYDALSGLADLDTHDTNLRDHPKAYDILRQLVEDVLADAFARIAQPADAAPRAPSIEPVGGATSAERMVRLFERNRRVVARYDELMREGKHGHYETMFRVVHEEVQRESNRADLLQEDIDSLHMCLDDRKVPRTDAGGNVYSMWGRVQLYVKQPRLGVPPGAGVVDWRMRVAAIAAECADHETQAALDKLLEDAP